MLLLGLSIIKDIPAKVCQLFVDALQSHLELCKRRTGVAVSVSEGEVVGR